jgi:hypothetical protein
VVIHCILILLPHRLVSILGEYTESIRSPALFHKTLLQTIGCAIKLLLFSVGDGYFRRAAQQSLAGR